MEDYIGKICPFCKTEIAQGDTVKVCPSCGIPHHEGCWEENKGCTTFGCTEQYYEEQHTNPTDVCQNCGAPLGDGQAFCPKCGTKKEEARENVCGKCGAQLREGQEFCSKCGQKVGAEIDTSAQSAINEFNNSILQKNNKSKDFILYVPISILAGVFLFVKGFFTNTFKMSLYSTSIEHYSHSFKTLVTYTSDFLIIIPILICIFLFLIILFSLLKDKKKSYNVANMILSIMSFVSVLGFSLFYSSEYGTSFSDYSYDYGYIALNNSFDSFSVLFFVELILLFALFVLSFLNFKGKSFIKTKNNSL